MLLIKQPNGKYLTYSLFRKTTINLTEQDVINIYVKEAEEQAKRDMQEAHGLDCVLKDELKFGKQYLTERNLRDMGINLSKSELLKRVPLVPKNQKYFGCNFETVGECPSCGNKVVNGIGFKETKCRKCTQMLDWGGDY
jgi:hypothetical protein